MQRIHYILTIVKSPVLNEKQFLVQKLLFFSYSSQRLLKVNKKMMSRLWWSNVSYFNFCVIWYYSIQTSCLEDNTGCINIYDAPKDICENNYKIQVVKLSPYNGLFNLEDVIKWCCGDSSRVKQKDGELYNISQIPSALSKDSSDFILPCLASSTATTFYGYYFIPVIKAPSFFYITRKPKSVFVRVVKSSLDLYPLLTVVLLLVVITGFFAWLMETWSNKEEFPREFMTGWFEGFWWSFISMTTVGYGDKIPRSFPARLFSIIWIVTGVSFFGIITATLTTILTKENSPSAPTMSGANVGLIRHRSLDEYVIARNGGNPKYNNGMFLTYFEIDSLINKLRNKSIDGFLLDKYTMKDFESTANDIENEPTFSERVGFYFNNTIKTEVIPTGFDMSYGILVKEKKVYEFFRPVIMDIQLNIETKINLEWNRKKKRIDEPFSLSEPYFLFMIQIMLGIIGLITMFGVTYEIIRRYFYKKGKKAEMLPQKQRTHKQSRSFLHA